MEGSAQNGLKAEKFFKQGGVIGEEGEQLLF